MAHDSCEVRQGGAQCFPLDLKKKRVKKEEVQWPASWVSGDGVAW